MIIGNYVKTFADGDMGMLQGVSMNAPYEFHWLYVKEIKGNSITFLTRERGGREIEAKIWKTKSRNEERSEVTVSDPLFGPQRFVVAPFKRSKE